MEERNNEKRKAKEDLDWLLREEEFEKRVVCYRPDDPWFENANLKDYATIFERDDFARIIVKYIKKSRESKRWIVINGEKLANQERNFVEMGYFVPVKGKENEYILTEHAADKIAEYFSR